jgi:hypothetical protein
MKRNLGDFFEPDEKGISSNAFRQYTLGFFFSSDKHRVEIRRCLHFCLLKVLFSFRYNVYDPLVHQKPSSRIFQSKNHIPRNIEWSFLSAAVCWHDPHICIKIFVTRQSNGSMGRSAKLVHLEGTIWKQEIMRNYIQHNRRFSRDD